MAAETKQKIFMFGTDYEKALFGSSPASGGGWLSRDHPYLRHLRDARARAASSNQKETAALSSGLSSPAHSSTIPETTVVATPPSAHGEVQMNDEVSKAIVRASYT